MDASLSTLSGVFAQRYSIEKTIGRGATASVYLARDAATDRPVAIKILKRELAETIGGGRFLREIRLTQGLHHPRILPVLDSGEFEGKLYFVLPYMDGGTLRDRLQREHQLPLKEAVEITCTVADALAHAHQQGYIHRDVKPENILLSNGEACLADFGIARAIERSVEDTTTSTGIARGTAAYMSPEQASGGHEYDGRSDIYSLGCVLYELIAGVPAFIGATPEAVIAQRFVHPPRELKVYRRNVPEKIDAAIRRAMQLSAADRYRTAGEFVTALSAITDADYAKAEREAKWWRKIVTTPTGRAALASGAALTVVAVAFTATRLSARRAAIIAADTTHIVLFPIEGRAGGNPAWRDDDLMNQALSRWSGLQVVDQFQVADVVNRTGHNLSTEQASSVAKSLGAGRYIRGKLTALGKNWRAYVVLYDAVSGRALYKAADSIPGDLTAATAAYSRLADSLLLRGAEIDSTPTYNGGTRSLPALQAFARGQSALDEWNLSAADSAFQQATVFDSYFGRAALWLAQVRAWRSLPVSSWASLAERASSLAPQLTEREQQLGTALVLLERAQYPRACEEYRRLRTRNDRDFAAWFGLGQCRMMDRIVVADSRSPSKWRFRSSVAPAMTAYSTAFRILPSVHKGYERGAFENLERLLLLSTDLRTGYRESDSAVFYGRLGFVADSLVMIPYPVSVIAAGDSNSIPPGFAKAIAQRRNDFRQLAASWSSAFPSSAIAKHAVAESLDLLGDPSSVDTIRLARRLELDATRRLNLAAEEVILLVKFGVPDDLARLRAARALADSVLSDYERASSADVEALASVAALRGRCAKVDLLSHAMVPATGFDRISGQLLGDANALTSRVAMGCPMGQVNFRSLSSHIARTYAGAEAAERERAEQTLLYRAVTIGFRVDPRFAERFTHQSSDNLLHAVNAVVRNVPVEARTALIANESHIGPGVITPDVTLSRAQLWLDVADTAMASARLDKCLDALITIATRDLRDPVNTGALVSGMILRSRLGPPGDGAQRRWALAVRELWSGSDDELQPVVSELSVFAKRR